MNPRKRRLVDALVIVAAGILAHVLDPLLPGADLQTRSGQWLLISAVAALMFLPTLGAWGEHSLHWRPSVWFQLSGRWSMLAFLALLWLFEVAPDAVPRRWLGEWIVLCVLLAAATKWLLPRLQHQRAHKRRHKTVAVIGSQARCQTLIERIKAAPWTRFKAICVFDVMPSQGAAMGAVGAASAGGAVSGVPACPRFDDLARMVRLRLLSEIWLALPLSEEGMIARCLHEFRHDFVTIRYMPDINGLPLCNHAGLDVLGTPTFNLAAARRANVDVLLKSVFDKLFAAFALLLLWPSFIVIAVLIKSSSPGPVFFRQRRMGADGRVFSILKFRSMKLHVASPGHLPQATKGDSRVTRIGALLRRTSLDELPQFINVLRGDMSVVGPRPHALEHDDFYKEQVDGYMYRYRIKPGITGWAQVHGFRGETEQLEKMQARVELDLYYMQNWNLWLDLKIIFATIKGGFVGTNAY